MKRFILNGGGDEQQSLKLADSAICLDVNCTEKSSTGLYYPFYVKSSVIFGGIVTE